MTTQGITEMLSSISIGTILAWIAVLSGVVSAIGAIFIKIYKVFDKARSLKDTHDKLHEVVDQHSSHFEKIFERLGKIEDSLNEQHEASIRKMRHTIIKTCEEALMTGSISIRRYKSVCELYDTYKKHGNGYVSSLMKQLENNVKIVGKLNDAGEDVDDN